MPVEVFVVFDCGAVAHSILESELFGHAKGAFTGAASARRGLFAEAHGGTLFLDEIGELPLDLQPRLLRALEAGEVRPVGSNETQRVDVRIIAATHRELRSKVEANEFRADLYYRLAVVEVRVPPLRERKEDLPLLVEHFLCQLDPPKTLLDLAPGTLDLLQSHHWPGNLHELRNTTIRLALFPELGRGALEALGAKTADLSGLTRLTLPEVRERVVSEFEHAFVSAKLEEHRGNVTAAARSMGVSRQFLHRLMSQHGVRSPR